MFEVKPLIVRQRIPVGDVDQIERGARRGYRFEVFTAVMFCACKWIDNADSHTLILSCLTVRYGTQPAKDKSYVLFIG